MTNTQEQKAKNNEDLIAKAKEQARKDLLAEQKAEKETEKKARNEKIREIQKKKKKTDEDKAFLKREMPIRAKENSLAPKNLDKIFPSQMTLEEMTKYCKEKKIKIEEDDTTVVIRLRIKAFRNPAQAERLRMLKNRPVEDRIIRSI